MDAPPLAAPPPLRVSPELPLEIVEDIFILVPPEDCAFLLRAALACKTWAHLFASRGFSRRYRQRHRGAAPLLGFLANLADTGGAARFIPATISGGGFRPFRADSHGYRAHDARYGRVLLSRVSVTSTTDTTSAQSIFLAVWVPITGEVWRLPPLLRHRPVRSWNAAVICDPFRVVVVGMDTRELFVYTYVPEAHAWFVFAAGKPVSDQLDGDVAGVLVSDALHFVLLKGTRILKYHLLTREVSTIRLPNRRRAYGPRITLMAMEDGRRLGFAEVCTVTNILRFMALNIGRHGETSWEMIRFIDLHDKLPAEAISPLGFLPRVVAVAEGVDVVFLKTADGLTLDLKSGKVTKIPMTNGFFDIIPYVSFYVPVLKAALVVPSGVGTSGGASTSGNNVQHVDHLG
ncbi:hypothetical protein HU200_066365 [Digitaria exilis]|uniref:F-box domain-containing protein n=1 Tax=Digitaria exilis TaxID=1010633 RepID=A0A835A0C6_9POAL|nr:hypothetical protein HU200_066365 [Digitaria exilis]